MSIKAITLCLCFISFSWAHGILLMAEPAEEDGMLYIEGALGDGTVPAGAKIVLHEQATGRPLWQGQLPEEGYITVEMPEVPYTVSLIVDRSHSRTIPGPLDNSEEADTTNEETQEIPQDRSTEEPIIEDEDAENTRGFLLAALILFIISGAVGFRIGFNKKRQNK
ncbi:MAG: hypothetical protein ACQEQ4_05190 [Fibrobacterota bacterium]